jgi:hypothetical protein
MRNEVFLGRPVPHHSPADRYPGQKTEPPKQKGGRGLLGWVCEYLPGCPSEEKPKETPEGPSAAKRPLTLEAQINLLREKTEKRERGYRK